jgi:hypothetical protein
MCEAGLAFEYPLSANAVREAYFLGQRRDSATADFLAKYVKRLPATKTGWQVMEMEVRTPYTQAVLRSWQSLPGYTPQQAAEEFKKRDPHVIVRVYLVPCGAGKGNSSPRDFRPTGVLLRGWRGSYGDWRGDFSGIGCRAGAIRTSPSGSEVARRKNHSR